MPSAMIDSNMSQQPARRPVLKCIGHHSSGCNALYSRILEATKVKAIMAAIMAVIVAVIVATVVEDKDTMKHFHPFHHHRLDCLD